MLPKYGLGLQHSESLNLKIEIVTVPLKDILTIRFRTYNILPQLRAGPSAVQNLFEFELERQPMRDPKNKLFQRLLKMRKMYWKVSNARL